MPFAPPPIQNTNISTLYNAGDNVLIYRTSKDAWVKSTVVRFVEETSKYEVKYDKDEESYFELLQPGGDNHFPML